MSDELRERLLDLLSDDEVEQLLEVIEAAPPKATKAEREAGEDNLRYNHELRLAAGELDAIVAEIHLNMANWAENFGMGALHSGKAIDQSEVDEKRGYFRGALFYTERLPVAMRARQRKAAAKAEGGEA